MNRGADGDGFDFRDVTDDLEGLNEMPLKDSIIRAWKPRLSLQRRR